MQRTLVSILIFLALLAPEAIWAQDKALERADRFYEDLSYYQAILNYESAFQKGADDTEHIRRLADSYRQLRDMENAEVWYRQLSKKDEATAGDKLRYAEVLRANGKYEQADEWMASISEDFNSGRSDDFRNSRSNVESLLNDGLFKGIARPLSSNTITADWSPFIVGNQLVFASSRTKEMSFKGYHGYDGKAFMDLFVGEMTAKGDVPKVRAFSNKLNTGYHESNPSFTADGNELFFTRNHLEGKYLGRSSEGVNNLQIYSSRFENGKWKKAMPFEHNSAEWSSGHPAISPDGSLLIFVSDRPGGEGGSDLYICERIGGDAWTEPRNLGPRINTEANEMSPYIHHDGTMFFASDGHFGIGGMDIFLSMMNGTEPGEVMNVGAPINSRFDELCLVLDPSGRAGYFSSNRPGGAGDDDIYRVDLFEVFDRNSFYSEPEVVDLTPTVDLGAGHSGAFRSTRTINATVRDVNTGAVLEGVQLLFDEQARSGAAAIRATSDPSGVISMEVPFVAGQNNDLLLTKEGYLPRLITMESEAMTENVLHHQRTMDLVMSPLEEGMDLAVAIGLEPVYFEVESWEITEQGALQLDRIVFILETHPHVNIEVGSHTDSQGSSGFNDVLSEMRAHASREYLIAAGIDGNRILSRGYGESKPVNECVDGVECTEDQHRLNRRTEFIVVGL